MFNEDVEAIKNKLEDVAQGEANVFTLCLCILTLNLMLGAAALGCLCAYLAKIYIP